MRILGFAFKLSAKIGKSGDEFAFQKLPKSRSVGLSFYCLDPEEGQIPIKSFFIPLEISKEELAHLLNLEKVGMSSILEFED